MNYSDAMLAYNWWSTCLMTVDEIAAHLGVTTDEVFHAIDVVQSDNEDASRRQISVHVKSQKRVANPESIAVAAYVAEGLGEW